MCHQLQIFDERESRTMLMRSIFWVVLGLFWALQAPVAIAQEKRLALLIGNQSYTPSVGVLKNPHRDVNMVGAALAKQGFELLPALKDARRSEILGAIRDLVRRLNEAGSNAIGFIYYSGHGASEKDTRRHSSVARSGPDCCQICGV
jgi:hypothetical protein